MSRTMNVFVQRIAMRINGNEVNTASPATCLVHPSCSFPLERAAGVRQYFPLIVSSRLAPSFRFDLMADHTIILSRVRRGPAASD